MHHNPPTDNLLTIADPISRQQIETLRSWVAQGGCASAGGSFSRRGPRAPHSPSGGRADAMVFMIILQI